MPTPTRYREVQTGDGNYACVENNKRNAQRGTFVVQGGEMTPGVSSSEVVVNIESTEFRADGVDYTLNDGQATLTRNSTPYPRRDLVVAEVPQSDTGSASYRVLEGDPIDSDTMQSLVAEGRVAEDGTPIYPVMALPQVQPPPAQGLLNQATVLGMWYVPPSTADSTDLTDQYKTDLRMSGIGVDDVLRSGGAITEVEAKEGTLDVTASDSERVGGQPLRPIEGMQSISLRREDVPAGGAGTAVGFFATGNSFAVLQYGVFNASSLGVDDNWAIEFRDQNGNYVTRNAGTSIDSFETPHGVYSSDVGNRFTARLVNTADGSGSVPLTGNVQITTTL